MCKKGFSLVLVFIMLVSSSIMVFAGSVGVVEADDGVGIKPAYSYINSVNVNLKIEKGVAECYGKVDIGGSNKVTVDVELQKLSGGSWVKVKMWSGSGSGVQGAKVVESYPVTAGSTYRVKVTGKVLDNNGKVLESEIKYSDEKRY